jgi:hypothetical protein
MFSNQVPIASALLGLCVVTSPAGQEKILPQKVSGSINWVYSYAEGKEAARQSGKPMFVVFRCER